MSLITLVHCFPFCHGSHHPLARSEALPGSAFLSGLILLMSCLPLDMSTLLKCFQGLKPQALCCSAQSPPWLP